MAAVDDFIQFLVADMEATASTTFCDNLLTAAKAKITAGGGQLGFLENATLNGKTFAMAKQLSALDVARACRAALDLYQDNDGPSFTVPDFSRISL